MRKILDLKWDWYRIESAWSKPGVRRTVGAILLWILIVRPLIVTALLLPGPWGASVGGGLPDGTRIEFRTRRVGRETDDQLVWTFPEGKIRIYRVNCIHAGNYSYVKLHYCDFSRLIYLESSGEVKAALLLETDEFFAEGVPHSPNVVDQIATCQAVTIAEGRTGTLLQLLWPL